jgi:hypothetical protein
MRVSGGPLRSMSTIKPMPVGNPGYRGWLSGISCRLALIITGGRVQYGIVLKSHFHIKLDLEPRAKAKS